MTKVSLRVVGGLGDTIVCAACRVAMTGDRIAMLLRYKPGGDFDATCVDCATFVCKQALLGLAAQDAATVDAEAPETRF